MDRRINWLDLPSEILLIISDKLIHIKDYICFGAVCHPWRSIYIENHHRLPHQLPMLMFPTQHVEHNADFQTCSLYDLSQKRLHNIPFPLPHNKYLCGSTQGWLVFYVHQRLHLLNPFLSVDNLVGLPYSPFFENEEDDDDDFELAPPSFRINDLGDLEPIINKVVLLASKPNYVVMAIHNDWCDLALYKSSDNSWNTVVKDKCYQIDDIIYYRDQFYAVDCYGAVWSCDVTSPYPILSKVEPWIDNDFMFNYKRKYIVESSGDLLLVRMAWDLEFKAVDFEVFKLDQIAHKWVELKNLCGQMLFVGRNTSMSRLASDFPGCSPNRIYFTSERYCMVRAGIAWDMGVYNLETGSIESLNPMELNTILIEPTLLGRLN